MRHRGVIVVAALVVAAGCGGGDPQAPASSGTNESATAGRVAMPDASALYGTPPPGDEDLREMFDLSRDLQAVAAEGDGAAGDLRDDLAAFAPEGTQIERIEAMAGAVSNALSGHALSQEQSERMAVRLYVALQSSRLTPDNRDRLASDLRQSLLELGAASSRADAVAGHVATLASAAQ